MLGGEPVDVITTFQTRDQGWSALCWGSSPIDDNPGYTGKLDIAYPFHPDGQGTIAEVAAGDFDQEWEWAAQQIATWGDERIYFRLAWEFNAAGWTWSATNPSEWIAAFRRIVGIMRTHAPDAKIVWCMNAHNSASGTPPSGDAWDCYPGDEYVDIIAIDSYDFFPASITEEDFDDQAAGIHGIRYVADQARARGKRFAVPEWGLVGSPNGNGGGDNLVYLQGMYDVFAENADILEYECYFQTSDGTGIGAELVNWSNPASTPANPLSAALFKDLWQASSYAANPDHFISQKGWATTNGGAGGTVLKVTNLNASGAGSLRAALEASGTRTVVFEVSGVIDLSGAKITIENGSLTVAGQTAPSPGIAIIKGMIDVDAEDVIFSHLFMAAGTLASSEQTSFATSGGANRLILDHCACFWGLDGTMDVGGYGWNGANASQWRANTAHNVTVSACVIAESLSGLGSLIEDNTNNILLTRNYFYAAGERNGHFKGGVRAVSANNLIYNPTSKFFDYTLIWSTWQGEGATGNASDYPGDIDLIGNVCKAGPDTTTTALFTLVSNGDVNLYLHDNEAKRVNGTDYDDTDISDYLGNPQGDIFLSGSPRLPGHGETFMPRTSVPSWIMTNVGPRPWDRMAHVQRVLDHYTNGTGAQVTNQASVGGYPSLAQNTRAFDPDLWDMTTMTPTSPEAL